MGCFMRKIQILVVEDESIIALDIKGILESRGYVVPAVLSDGQEALSRALEIRPNLILSDVKLAGAMDGVEMVRQLRKQLSVPVIFLTAHTDPATLDRIKKTLPNGIIVKPVNEHEVYLSVEMALYRYRMETRLREREKKYRDLFEHLRDASYITDRDGIIIDVNEFMEEQFGYGRREIIGRKLGMLFTDPADRGKIIRDFGLRGYIKDYPVRLRKKDGTEIHCLGTASMRTADDGSLKGYQGILRDISMQRLLEEKLQNQYQKMELQYRELKATHGNLESAHERLALLNQELTEAERRLRTANDNFYHILRTNPLAVIIARVHDGMIIEVSESCLDLFGYTRGEIIGKRSVELGMWHTPAQREEIIRKLQMRQAVRNIDVEIVTKSGEKRWGLLFADLVEVEHSEEKCLLSIFYDITDKKRNEEAMKSSLREKETLLKEIHHRVKNNLQVISSLLNLQLRFIREERDIELFKESRDRVRSMALIHERLYQSGDFSRVDFEKYIRDICSHLYRVYNGDLDSINVIMDVRDVYLDIDDAIPCGLIINELVSNAFKHAFKGMKNGRLTVRFNSEGALYTLVVRDNGCGMPADRAWEKFDTLGLHLINMLVTQLHGTLTISPENGSEFKITFLRSVKTGGDLTAPIRGAQT